MTSTHALSARGTTTYKLYNYTPSIVGAVIFIIVFACLTAAHGYRMIKTRIWYCAPIVVGGLFETVGYIGRAIGHSNRQALTPFIIQSILILVAPALFAATIYMTLGRTIRALNAEAHSVIPLKWLTKIFVTGDVFSFFIIGGGGGIQAGGDGDKVKLGQDIILGGLLLQIILFGLFVSTAVVFHLRLRKAPAHGSDDQGLDWQKMLSVLYAVSAVIMTRNVFRVVEYALGRDAYLLRVEWPTYIFDAVLMTAVMVTFFVGYPTLIRSNRRQVKENVELGSAEVVDGGRTVLKT